MDKNLKYTLYAAGTALLLLNLCVCFVLIGNFVKTQQTIKEEVATTPSIVRETDDMISTSSLSDFYVPAIHCLADYEGPDTTLKFGMKDTSSDTRISNLQKFLVDYYKDSNYTKTGEVALTVTEVFDEVTLQFVKRFNDENGLTGQDFYDGNMRSLINPRCHDAGYSPKLYNLTAEQPVIHLGESTGINVRVAYTTRCQFWNWTDWFKHINQANYYQHQIFDSPIAAVEGKLRPTDVSYRFRVSPQETSYYVLQCDNGSNSSSGPDSGGQLYTTLKVEVLP